MEFSSNLIKETKEISQNVYVDLDENGDIVNMTLEHAKKRAKLPDVSVEQMTTATF